MIILSIDTSCDETSVAVTENRRVLAQSIYSQILIHKKWGGVVPSLAKRAHEERIDLVIEDTISKFTAYKNVKNGYKLIDAVAVTVGPGLAMALEVGIQKAKEISLKHNKKIIEVNHIEGHIYSPFVENRNGNPKRVFTFPYLALVVSGGHTELVLWKDHLRYEILGRTLDDASGEALDKASKMLGLGYPGGAVIEQLASQVHNEDMYRFPRPMIKSNDLNFSFSGLKTSLYYFLNKMKEKDKLNHLKEIASSFQNAVFDAILIKTEKAIKQTGITKLTVGGGVVANKYLRSLLRNLVSSYKGTVLFPPYSYLTGDNAAMIGVVAYYMAIENKYSFTETIDRKPRFSLS